MHIFGACVRITAEQIPGLSRILHLDFPDFTQLNSFSGTFQVLKILQTNFQDFAGPNSFSRTFQDPGNFTDTIPLSSRTFQDTWEPCVYTSPRRRRPNCYDDRVCLYMYAAAEPGICIRWTVPSPLLSSISHLFPFPLEVGSTLN